MKPEQINRDERAAGVSKELKRQAAGKQRRDGKKLQIIGLACQGYSR